MQFENTFEVDAPIDRVYETMLDGYELQELREVTGVHIEHLLIVDSHLTWWVMGRSYLCRIIDMLNMHLVDEVRHI